MSGLDSAADVLVIGPNAALELTYFLPEAPRAGVVTAEGLHVEPGGKATNVARVLHQLGTSLRLLTGLAGPVGGAVASALSDEGVPVTAVREAPPTRASVVLVGQQYVAPAVIRTDGQASPRFVQALSVAVQHALQRSAPRLVAMAGSLPQGFPADFYGRMVAAARRSGVDAYVDAAGEALLGAADAGATVLTPNAVELAEAVSLAGTSTGDLLVGAASLRRRGAMTVIVTCGSDGMLVVDPSGAWQVTIRPTDEVNGAGAGDAFFAGLLSAAARGDGDRDAVAFAARCGAAAVTQSGSGRLPDTWADIPESVVRWTELHG